MLMNWTWSFIGVWLTIAWISAIRSAWSGHMSGQLA
jgi:hypothetical protein